MNTPRCPRCKNQPLIQAPSGHFTCPGCRQTFMPPGAAAGRPMRPSSISYLTLGIVLGGLFFLLLGGIVLTMMSFSRTDPEQAR
jgi:hypothetical protein